MVLRFALKRMLLAFFVISGSFAFIYSLAATVGDPLAEIRLSNPPNLEYLLLATTRELRLDQSIPERFFGWYSDVIKSVFSGDFTLGVGLNGRAVSEGLLSAVAPTFWLVIFSIFASLTIGALCGVFVAAKRYSLRESAISLITFLGFVAPVFWVGHLLKQYIVVVLNDVVSNHDLWLESVAIFIGSLSLLLSSSFLFLNKYSFDDKNARNKFFVTLFIALPLMSLTSILLPEESTYKSIVIIMLGVFFFWVIFWYVIGRGLLHRLQFGVRFAFLWFGSLIAQKLISVFPHYMQRDEIGGRPFPSFAYESVWYTPPEFWIQQLDRVLHLVLPTSAIVITTVAIYYQVTKNAAIEALESDYVRMARAKGVNELEVLIRHVFRSCYLSLLNTFVPNYLYLFNGVIIIELVFGWQGVGVYLMDSMFSYDLNRLMGGVFVIGIITFFGMVGSDLLSSRVDPRIREFR